MKIFISYSSSDRLHAFELFKILENNGHDVWLDYFDIMPSEKLEQELTNNITQADVVCIIFSPNSMSSKWVEYEIKAASQNSVKKPRILGIIIHSCKIPDFVSDIIHLDARNGMQDQAFLARLLRAIDKTEIKDQEQLLDLAHRKELARLSVVDKANKDLPFRVADIEDVADKKIDTIQIRITPSSLTTQEKIIYELKLINDSFNDSMHFYFTTYEEGHTWPEEFGFSEPSFKDFFMARKPKIDGKFAWYDEVFDFVDTMYGSDYDDPPASFSFTFTGKEFNKGKSEFYAITKLEFPTIRELLRDNSTFELIAHFPDTKTMKKLNVFNAEIDLQFSISLKEEKKWFKLFDSRHTQEEELAYLSDFMKNNPNMIYQELLMKGFDEKPKTLENRKEKIIKALHEDKEIELQDFSIGGFYANSQGNLYYFRTNYYEANKWYSKAIELLQPAVEKYPTYKEAMVIFFASKRLADCVDLNTNADLKAQYLNNLIIIGRHLTEKFPDEIDYKRLLAIGLLHNAEIKNYNQEPELAASDLVEGIAIYKEVYDKIPTAENYTELHKMKTAAIEHYHDTPMAQLVPLQKWEIDLTATDRTTDQEGPIWLKDATDANWPVEMFNSPLLRYVVAVPQKWGVEPILSNTQMEVKHLFKGRTPSEFFSISFMDKAIGGRMTSWVDAGMQMVGFPILEISRDTNPVLLDWTYEGAFDLVAKRYVADEAHCYSGIIELNDKNRHRGPGVYSSVKEKAVCLEIHSVF